MSDYTQDQVFVHRITVASIGGDFSLAREYGDEVAAELTALRQQVADLRAALIEAYDAVDAYAADTGVMLRVNRAVLAATQPQEVQG